MELIPRQTAEQDVRLAFGRQMRTVLAAGELLADRKTLGTFYGLLGMFSFSLTLPATRAAVLHFHPSVVAFVRPVFAAFLAAALLITMGKPLRTNSKASLREIGRLPLWRECRN